MKKVIFLESCIPSLECKGNIVSLDPGVSYFLHKNKIKYNILKDYYDEKELRSCEEVFFFEQLKWFDSFDNFLKKYITLCKEYSIPLVKANYLRIKYLTDTVIINSFILSQFFQNNPDLEEISYFNESFSREFDYSIFEFKSKNRKVFCDLLRLFCKKYNIQFINNSIDKEKLSLQESHFNSLSRKGFVRSQIKKIINLVKYEKFKKLFSLDTSFKSLNVFFMHAGSLDIDYPIREIIKHKAHIYLQEDSNIMREDVFLRKPVDMPELDECFLRSLQEESKTCAENLEKNAEIISWINDKCLMDVSSIVLPFLKYFISQDCSYILQDAKIMFNFYKQKNINYVLARGNTERNSLGALVAAKYMKGSKSICVQHACFALDMEVFGVFETETYNCIVTRDDISKDYFKHSNENRYNSGCKVVQSSYYLESMRRKYFKKDKGGKVIYVQKKFSDRVRCFNNMIYPLTWYFEFQRELIDFFAEELSFDFIYKHSQGQEWAEHSILRYIEDKGYKNIDVSKRHFLKTIEFADRVIMDYPSGSLFEAAVSGKPVLCLCADYFKILKNANTVFGKSLRQFSSIDEAILIIKEFLYGNPQEYIVDISLSDNDFMDVFKYIEN